MEIFKTNPSKTVVHYSIPIYEREEGLNPVVDGKLAGDDNLLSYDL